MKPNHCINSVETEFITATLREDGIVHIEMKTHTHITVEVQDKMRETYWEVAEKDRPFVFEGGEFISITKKARSEAVRREHEAPISATALVVKNLGQKIIADYYYRFNKPTRPLKVFKKFDDAIIWLQDYL